MEFLPASQMSHFHATYGISTIAPHFYQNPFEGTRENKKFTCEILIFLGEGIRYLAIRLGNYEKIVGME